MWKSLAVLFALLPAVALAADDGDRLLPTDYAEARSTFQTKIPDQGPSPQQAEPLPPPPDGVREVEYKSGELTLKAWLADKNDGAKHPAVIYCHGGFAFGMEDFTQEAAKFAEQGFVTLAPMVRGENGLPGNFELFLGEVDDVVAAGRFVASLPSVDPKRVFVCGHSAGATLALFAALLPDSPYAASMPIGPSMDLVSMLRKEFVPLFVFDVLEPHEMLIRSPMYFGASLKRPSFIFVGNEDVPSRVHGHHFAAQAAGAEAQCQVRVVPGDHHSCKPEAIKQIISLLKEFRTE